MTKFVINIYWRMQRIDSNYRTRYFIYIDIVRIRDYKDQVKHR